MSLHLFKHCNVASCGEREWEGTAVSLGPRVTPPATLPLQEGCGGWSLQLMESLSGQLCAGAEEAVNAAQAVNGAETFPGGIWNEKSSSHWTQPLSLQGPILGKHPVLICCIPMCEVVPPAGEGTEHHPRVLGEELLPRHQI